MQAIGNVRLYMTVADLISTNDNIYICDMISRSPFQSDIHSGKGSFKYSHSENEIFNNIIFSLW